MKKHAILCGSAPDGFTQKKINEMHDFLTSEAGGSWAEKEITIFPNGVSEAMLSFMLERLKADKTAKIFLYVCTLSPVADEDKSVWLGGEEVRKSVLESVVSADSVVGSLGAVEFVVRRNRQSAVSDGFNGIQVIYDCDGEFVGEEEFDSADTQSTFAVFGRT